MAIDCKVDNGNDNGYSQMELVNSEFMKFYDKYKKTLKNELDSNGLSLLK